MFSLAYMTIFLKHITNVALMREFLCYLMQGRYDDKPVLSTLIQNISSTNPLVRRSPSKLVLLLNWCWKAVFYAGIVCADVFCDVGVFLCSVGFEL